jgi:hypothetical protein
LQAELSAWKKTITFFFKKVLYRQQDKRLILKVLASHPPTLLVFPPFLLSYRLVTLISPLWAQDTSQDDFRME